MTTKRTVLLISLVCVGIAGSIYVFACSPWSKSDSSVPSPQAKVAASDTEDGTYIVRIRTITTTPEDTLITFTHVTYFEGDSASSSAAEEVSCSDAQPIEACVPTLTKGYYVRESGASTFMAPVTSGTEITLHDNSSASMEDIQKLNRQFDPVFEVVISNGNIESITELSPK
jgi:FlaG/FlaF family flagellin (archaellin)